MRNRRIVLALAFSLAAPAACEREPPTAAAPPAVEAPDSGGHRLAAIEEGVFDSIVHPARGRIALTITTTDPLLPNADVELDIRGVAQARIDSGEVVLTLTTKALMDHAGTGHPDLPAEASWDLPAMDSGDTWERSHAVSGEEAGYYRVMANAHARGPDGGPWLFDEAYRQAWMYVSETNGQLTRLFEDSVFPDSVHPAAGPADGAPSRSEPGSPWHSDSVYLAVLYSVNDRKGFKPAEGASVWAWRKGTDDFLGWRTVPGIGESEEHYIPGIVAYECTKSIGDIVYGGIRVRDTDLVDGRREVGSWRTDRRHCGQVVFVEARAHKYLPWRVLNLAAEAITDHFGYTRGPISWKLDWNPKGRSNYNGLPFKDVITLAWNPAGRRFRFTAAHEYGHALHHKALGGIWWRSPNCKRHWIDRASSYRCALKEGFAHYAGNVGSVTTNHPRGFYGDCFEHFGTPKAPPGFCRNVSHDRKRKIEGWIAALFTDLADNTGGEKGDWTSYPGRYVAEVFKTCEVKGKALGIFPDWKNRSRVSDIVWCLENRITPRLHREVFPGVWLPSKVRETAREPWNWDPLDIRSTWLKNLK
ncbi:MAG: hypothetical protein OXU64_10505 [Gemmatimonadota bacterium]|nr:hypothetical protein [Gemmatimonadota bacterium]